MASYIVSLILIVLALVSCVLKITATEENDHEIQATRDEKIEKDGEALEQALLNDHLTDEQIEQMLKSMSPGAVLYQQPNLQYWGRKVEYLADLCDVSLDKCSGNRAIEIKKLVEVYEDTIPRMFQYGQYCHDKLIDYCNENINQLVENFNANLSEEDKGLMKHFKEAVQKRKLLDRYHKVDKDLKHALFSDKSKDKARAERIKLLKQITEAYNECMRKLHEGPISLDQEELFLNKFYRFANQFFGILSLSDMIDEKHGLTRTNDSTDEFLKLATIIYDFYSRASNYFFWELQKRIEKKWGGKEDCDLHCFTQQTEDEILARQRERKEVAARARAEAAPLADADKKDTFGCLSCLFDRS